MRYYFDWDPNKATANVRKHKIGFDQAAAIFLDQQAVTIFDDEHSEIEDRWVTIGMDNNSILLVVVHTFHQAGEDDCRIRIVSAGKATRREANQYRKGTL